MQNVHCLSKALHNMRATRLLDFFLMHCSSICRTNRIYSHAGSTLSHISLHFENDKVPWIKEAAWVPLICSFWSGNFTQCIVPACHWGCCSFSQWIKLYEFEFITAPVKMNSVCSPKGKMNFCVCGVRRHLWKLSQIWLQKLNLGQNF